MFIPTKSNDKYGEFSVFKSENTPVKPIVSVIMSVYDSASSLHSSIESILNQSFLDIEVVVTNDGSKDDSLKILLEYQKRDSRLVVIDQANLGLTKSLNRMINLARGNYIARQDSDDISNLERIATQYKALEKSSCNFCISRYSIRNRHLPNIKYVRAFNIKSLYFGNYMCHGTFFGKKEVFNLMYNDEHKYAQDIEFVLRNSQSLKIIFLEDVLYEYMLSEDQISMSKKAEQFESFAIACKLYFGLRPIKHIFLRKSLRFLYLNFKYYYANLLSVKS